MAKRQCTKCSGVISSANIEVATPKLRRRSVSVGVAQGIGRERRPLWPVVKGDLIRQRTPLRTFKSSSSTSNITGFICVLPIPWVCFDYLVLSISHHITHCPLQAFIRQMSFFIVPRVGGLAQLFITGSLGEAFCTLRCA